MTTSDLIKRTAISLIAQSGFSSVSLRHLARECGIQPGSVYCHYSSKEELLQEIVHEYLQGFLLVWKRSRRTKRPPGVALRRFVSLYCGYILSNLESGLVAELDLRSLDEEGLSVALAFKHEIEIELVSILEDGQRQGVFALEHRRSAAVAIISLVSGLCMRRYVGAVPAEPSLSRQLEAFVASIVNEKSDYPGTQLPVPHESHQVAASR